MQYPTLPLKRVFFTVNEHYIHKGMYSVHPVDVFRDKKGTLRNYVHKALFMSEDFLSLAISAISIGSIRNMGVTTYKKNRSPIDSFQYTWLVAASLLDPADVPEGEGSHE